MVQSPSPKGFQLHTFFLPSYTRCAEMSAGFVSVPMHQVSLMFLYVLQLLRYVSKHFGEFLFSVFFPTVCKAIFSLCKHWLNYCNANAMLNVFCASFLSHFVLLYYDACDSS